MHREAAGKLDAWTSEQKKSATASKEQLKAFKKTR